MTKTLSIAVPHHLTQDQARQRIETGIAEARKQFGQQISAFEEHWTVNHLDFKLGVMGQSITGRADVEAQKVLLEVDLPWILAALSGKIEPQIREQATRLLADK